ncbi:hypothetical protein FQA39_LY13181 [Lamprigera yunnana]|nr:hypothetical protein FQA39_LY13181 [Lamprigera yunnana]
MTSTFQTKYRLIEQIGEGSFSEVLKCADKTNGKCFAAKRLKKIFKNIHEVERCAEILATTKLSKHANIVYMLEFHYDLTTGRLIFIFELMDLSLYDFLKLKKRRIPEVKVRYYLYQLLKGLDHLHKNGLFHRDIKPENILIKIDSTNSNHQNEVVKLADFGSIRDIHSKPPYTEYISTRWYRSPECLLTVGYYGPKMDIWATGCVFYELLMSKPLFPGSDEIDQLYKIHSVLGTPSERTLFKLKKKSRNFSHFPKQIGTGLKQITCNVSDEALYVLELMLQYDQDVRINVRRLLEHGFFKTLRDDDLMKKYSHSQQLKSKSGFIYKSTGDFLPQKFPKKEHKSKYKTPVCRSSNNLHIKEKSMIPKPMAARTTLDVTAYNSHNDTYQHALRHSPGPLVNSKQMKSWGVNPNILKAKQLHKTKIESEHIGQSIKRKIISQISQTKRITGPYSKTISDLPQISKGTQIDVQTSTQLYSKSFVLPQKYWKAYKKNDEYAVSSKNKKIRKH